MKSRLAIAVFLVMSLCASAQSDNFRRQFDEFRRQAVTSQTKFRDECNRAYADFLRKAWESYRSDKVEVPKEVPITPVQFDTVPLKDNPVVIRDTVRSVPLAPRPEPVEPVKVSPRPSAATVSFNFYGTSFTVRADRTKIFRPASISEADVANTWNEISDNVFEHTLEDLLKIRDSHNFCDWAYLQMIHSFSSAFTEDENAAAVLSAWLLCQSGYKTRLARSDRKLYFLFASEYTIYGMNCFKINGEKFYCINDEVSQISIADACSFPKEQGLSFSIERQPALAGEYSSDRVLKAEEYASASVSSSVNANLIKFMDSYPDSQYGDNYMTRWAMYAETPLDGHSKDRIYPSLKKAIEGKSELEAANVLLNFVQTAFKYEYDDKVWGRDRVFFAEETLYYDYCDCEDRAILFSRLIRDLLALDVALIYFPNHLAAAVRFNSPVPGDFFVQEGKRYVVCDPTYIGAPVGATMPDMKGKEATLILLRR